MQFSKLEAEIVTHRLDVPDCIYEVLADTYPDMPHTEEDVIESCQRLTQLIVIGKDFEPGSDLDRLVLIDAVEGSVLEDIHPKAIQSIRVKVGLDQPPVKKAARPIPQNTATFFFNDGGRAAAGYQGFAGDCVARAVVIASGLPYQQVYDRLAEGNSTQRKTRRSGKNHGKKSARNGIATRRQWFKDYMAELGFVWTPTMQIGQGCKVHLKADELPGGTIIVSVSRHLCAVIDGVIHDTHDCSRGGTRCVYGYWKKA